MPLKEMNGNFKLSFWGYVILGIPMIKDANLPVIVNSSPLDKMSAISQMVCTFVNEKCYILIEISLKFISKGLIDNKPALV